MNEQNNLEPDKILKEVLELPYGASVADLGCGSMAFFTIAAAKLVGDKGVVYACDVIKEILVAFFAGKRLCRLQPQSRLPVGKFCQGRAWLRYDKAHSKNPKSD